MTNAKNTTLGHAYFDLKDYVQSLTCVDVSAQMAQSICFRIDISIAGAVRSLMKNLRRDFAGHGIESLTDMTRAMREYAFVEEVIKLAGKDDLGPVASIFQLAEMRVQWQELCAELTSLTFDYTGSPRVWEGQDIEELLLREANLTTKPIVRQRIKLQVERRAGDASTADIERVFEKRMAMEENKNKERSRSLNDQAQTLVTVYHTVMDMAESLPQLELAKDGYTDVEFYHLDATIRRAMIDGALQGAARAEEFATNSSSITDIEFDSISFAVLKIERELKAILAGPGYAVQRAMSAV